MTFHLGKPVEDARALELLNKTNQFNLNGRRCDEGDWAKFLKDPRAILVSVSYEDKYGKLGKIAVLTGRSAEQKFVLQSWVMSCRAFSRRIEFHCLKYLFEKFAAAEIVFELQATSRNGPLVECLQQLMEGPLEANPRLSKSSFLRNAPKMPHHVEEVSLVGPVVSPGDRVSRIASTIYADAASRHNQRAP